MNLYYFSQPRNLLKILNWTIAPAFGLTFLCFSVGLIYSLYLSPADYQQGDSVRIMYVHVPASWFALFIYGFIATFSVIFFVFRQPLAAYIASSAAPIGAIYTIISLVTGSIWGKPMWGTWWVWDARLTSMLILLFMYIGYLFLAESFEDKDRGLKSASALAILGIINLPIIKFSVDWWNTLHQPASLLRYGGPSIHSSMLIPLFWMAAGYLTLFSAVLGLCLKTTLMKLKLESLQAKIIRERFDS